MLRVFFALLLCILSFSVQSHYLHGYDVSDSFVSNENIEVERKNFNYDRSPNLQSCCSGISDNDLHEKTRDGSFFAVDVGLFAAKGAGEVFDIALGLGRHTESGSQLIDGIR